MSKKIRVAIIDDGINSEIIDTEVVDFFEIDNCFNVVKNQNIRTSVTHGTLCARIIETYYRNIEIVSIKIFDENMVSNTDKLIIALKLCNDLNVNVINLSLGTQLNDGKLLKVINELYYNSIITVASQENTGLISYPASYSNVIGVKRSSRLEDKEYCANKNFEEGIDFTANAVHDIRNAFFEKYTSNTNSFATPYITAKVCELLDNKSICFFNVKNKLITASEQFATNQFVYFKPDWLRKVIVYNVTNLQVDINKIEEFDIVKYIIAEDIMDKFYLSSGCNYFDSIILINNGNVKNIHYLLEYAERNLKDIVILESEKIIYKDTFFRKSIKVWSSNNINQYLNVANIKQNIIEQPIVKVNFDETFIMDVVIDIDNYFLQNQYSVYIASSYELCLLYGFNYYGDQLSYLNYMSNVINVENTDLVIIFDYNKNINIEEIDINIDISLANESIFFEYNNMKKVVKIENVNLIGKLISSTILDLLM